MDPVANIKRQIELAQEIDRVGDGSCAQVRELAGLVLELQIVVNQSESRLEKTIAALQNPNVYSSGVVSVDDYTITCGGCGRVHTTADGSWRHMGRYWLCRDCPGWRNLLAKVARDRGRA